MDEYAARALAKWPDVPDVFGWLALDRRGQWRLKDEIVRHRGLNAFLARSYGSDNTGRWFCQNGPQRVFVRLDYTPWVLNLTSDNNLITHTGQEANQAHSVWIDDQGCLLIECEHGIGVVSDRDLSAMLGAIVDVSGNPASDEKLLAFSTGANENIALRWRGTTLPLKRIAKCDLETHFAFVTNPVTNPVA